MLEGEIKKTFTQRLASNTKRTKHHRYLAMNTNNFFSKNITVHFGSHNDTVALPNGISSYINIQHK